MKYLGTALATALLLPVFAASAVACTNLLVTKGASTDGSVFITYTCDGEFHPILERTPAADHKPGDSVEIRDWHGNLRGTVKQVPHTFAVVGLMNEYQLAIGETTFDGREELENPDGLLEYWDMMSLALQRAKTAREAIKVMTDLVDEYGYRSTGETFSIADKNEAWIMEMIGPGKGGQGAIWVAMRVPDGMISCHANKARIGEFPLKDKKNCIYSKNVISFAVEKGYYNPKSHRPFLFNEAYCPSTPENRRYGDARVWSLFRRAAPSLNLSPDYQRAAEGSKPYPLWIKPDKQISLKGVFSLMRDHYEGTDFDMTKGVDAGPYGSPNRWRPKTWTVDSVEYAWERPISTQQTGFSFVSQSRSWLPDPVGGVYWYGVDDTYMTCYFPLYCCIDSLPVSYTVGNIRKFSWDSAWWVFNFVSNFANLKYSYMAPEILAVQAKIEDSLIAIQPALEDSAKALLASAPDAATKLLTSHGVSSGEHITQRWRELGEYLITKYNDGYVKDDAGRPQEKGYPESWLRTVIRERPDQFRLPEKPDSVAESQLID